MSRTNADVFREVFDLFATELWAMPEKDFLDWLNAEPKKEVVPRERYRQLLESAKILSDTVDEYLKDKESKYE